MDFRKYPGMDEELSRLCRTRPDELLQEMVDTDKTYDALRRERTQMSAALLSALPDGAGILDKYADAVFAQERYELAAVYRRGFTDALEIACEWGLL